MEEEEITFVLELRAAQSLTKAHEVQLLNYLKTSGNRIGLLENFAHPKAEFVASFHDTFRVFPCDSVAESHLSAFRRILAMTPRRAVAHASGFVVV